MFGRISTFDVLIILANAGSGGGNIIGTAFHMLGGERGAPDGPGRTS